MFASSLKSPYVKTKETPAGVCLCLCQSCLSSQTEHSSVYFQDMNSASNTLSCISMSFRRWVNMKSELEDDDVFLQVKPLSSFNTNVITQPVPWAVLIHNDSSGTDNVFVISALPCDTGQNKNTKELTSCAS